MVMIMISFSLVLAFNMYLGVYFNMWMFVDLLVVSLFMFMTNISMNESFVCLAEYFTVDILSFGLLMLTLFLFSLMYLSSSSIINKGLYTVNYNLFLVMLLISLILSFMVNNFIWFYILFEISLIPTLFIILGWGYQPERLQAGVYFMVYTLVASLPLLLLLVYLKNIESGSGMYDTLLLKYEQHFNVILNGLMGIFLILAFLVKLPMFLMHLWLPKAHVEAPVAGSMVLAGVLLKLGGYGLIRVLTKALNYIFGLTYIFVGLSLMGMVYVGLVCCRLNDLKALVAYSSVSHMGLVICGILSMGLWGVNGGLMMMISHGIGSSGLFCFVNMLYERVNSRSLFMNKGVISLLPLFSLFFFLLSGANISAPPTINLLSEISLIISVYNFESFSMFMFPLGSFLGAVFTFYLFSLSQHGKNYSGIQGVPGAVSLEFHLLVAHLLPMNTLILKNDFLFISY
uniref:NADH-ubiquinone oxidoreductase chain 4 n=1 Tax=Brachystomella parvula TaxID=187611 RepID=A0A650BJY9_9HEXA|nr:NADH dehydrogenase subunit 4 [Brachystomella parvula]